MKLSFCRMMSVVLKIIALVSYLEYFVDGTAPNSTCSCNETINASAALDECRCQLTEYCMKKFWADSDSTAALDESVMDVAFFPYKRSFGKKYPNLPAFNITFGINDERIKGLTFVFQKGCLPNASACRFLDFNSFKSSLRNAVLYSEEFYFHSPWGNSCTVEVKGLNNQLVPIYYRKFLTKVPDIDSLELNCAKLSRWQSFVTLDQTSYKDESMRLAFTTPPEQCNVTSFRLELIENNEIKSWEILEENTYRPIVYKQLHGIRPGVNYKVKLEIYDKSGMLCKEPCGISSSSLFTFEVQDSGVRVIIIIFTLISILIVTLIAGLIWIRRRKSKISYDKVIKVFMAYSYDIEQHRNVIKLFAEYLKQYCYCEVKLDIWDMINKDPQLWVSECISAADYVLIIWSRGAQLKMRKDNTSIMINEPGYLGNDLFSTAMTCITSKINKELRTPQYWRNLRKFVNISFPYVPSNAIPSQYDYLPFFKLPSGFNAFLCHLCGFDQSRFPFSLLPSLTSLTSCCRCYPLLPFSNLNETKEGKNLLKAIDEMIMLEKQCDWLQPLPFDYNDVDGLGPISYDSEDDDSDQGNCAPDSLSTNSETSESQEHGVRFPPPIHTLPIFGPGICDASEANWSPRAQSPDCFLPTSDRRLSVEISNFVSADNPLIGKDQQMDLPLDIFGPCVFELNK